MTVVPLGAEARPRRAQDSRTRLLAAARELFVERGYHATRPQDISRAAGLGHGTFYLHFGDKKACFMAFAEEARVELDAMIRTRLDGVDSLEKAVRGALESTYDYSRDHPGVLATAMTDAAVIVADADHPPTLVDRWADQWAQTLKSGAFGEQPLTADEAGILGAAIVGIIHEGSAYADRHGKSPATTIELLTRLIVKALT